MALKIRNEALYGLGILSYIVSLIPFFGINLIKSLILIPIIAYTLPIMEYLQPRAMSFKLEKKDVLLAILAAIPYLFMLSYFLIIPAILLALTFLFYYLRNIMLGNVLGTAFVASLSIAWAYFVNASVIPAIFWTLHIFTGALYVEYKIPHRKLRKEVIIVSWIASAILMIILAFKFFTPLILVALIEPSVRFLFPGEKLKSMKELANLGKRLVKRDILFVALLGILPLLSIFINSISH